MRRRRLSLPILEKKSGELQEPVKFWVLREYNPISFVGLPSVPRDLGPKPTSCLGACRNEVRTEVQGIGFIGRHGEFVGVAAW